MDTAQKNRLLENALKGLVKLIKACRFYPPRHPALKAAAEEARQGLLPLVTQGGNLSLTVRKEGFLLDEKPVAPENPVLKNLALLLFVRRIHRLTILADLSTADLRNFARGLGLDPSAVQKLGGFQEVLLKARVSTVWVNEVDLSRIHSRKEELETQKAALPSVGEEDFFDALAGEPQGPTEGAGLPAGERQRSLADVLAEIEAEKNDERFQQLLRELVSMIPEHLNDAGRNEVVRAFSLLCRNAAGKRLNPARREYSLRALSQLNSAETLDFLIDLLCLRGLSRGLRERLIGILTFLREKAVRRLMDRLAAERDASARRVLAEALIRHRAAAVPVLTEYLGDERWYVVRNAVGILGEIRDPGAANSLPPLLQHQDLRVRRETIRALTRIGGNEAVGILLRTVEEDNQDLRRQALLSLGAMKNIAAVPVLIALLNRPDAMSKNLEVSKEAIKALGEIGSSEAVPTLARILGRRSFWRRAQIDELRALTALALGDIGSRDPVAELEKATEDRSETVSRAAYQALKQIRKGQYNGPGTA